MGDSFDREMHDENERFTGKKPILKRIYDTIKGDPQFKDSFSYNLFLQRVEHKNDNILLSPFARKGTGITDDDIGAVRMYISSKHFINASPTDVRTVLYNLAFESTFHPLKDYLEGLAWDGTPRINTWLIDYAGTPDTVYHRAVSRKILVAMVRRVYFPGCYFAQLPILEGPQRIFKSRMLKELAGPWYASIHLQAQDSKVIVEESRGKWLCEIEELAGFSKQENEFLKSFISRQVDRVRLSYEREARDYPRQFILIATVNPTADRQYLTDTTGNVRYWPISTGVTFPLVKVDEMLKVRDQLFAEAMTVAMKEEAVWLDGKAEEELVAIEHEKRMVSDPWDEAIREFTMVKRSLPGTQQVTTVYNVGIDTLRLTAGQMTMGVGARIGRLMAKHGWIRQRSKEPDESGRRRYYLALPAYIKGLYDREETDSEGNADG